ncbi:MAG: hypothetical protein K0U98_07800 [Deltaproteobacteria bacterium]|nr:hypothetical protein [Deltaproteobacteria bacterium]
MSTNRQREALESYRSRGLTGAMSSGCRPAVVIVNLIGGLTEPVSPLGSVLESVVEATTKLANGARAKHRDIQGNYGEVISLVQSMRALVCSERKPI